MTERHILSAAELESLRQSVEASIYNAFAHVRRAGGVSWSEADVIDDYGSAKQRAEARLLDKDTKWQQLVDDPRWNMHGNSANFTFLDPIGQRYYLPAIMVRSMRGRDTPDLCDNVLSVGGALDDAQLLAVAGYIHFMLQRALVEERRLADERGYETSMESAQWRQCLNLWNIWELRRPFP